VFLTLNKLLLFFDSQLMEIDLRPYRLLAALAGLAFLLYGFIFESECASGARPPTACSSPSPRRSRSSR
jgi:hypothetical protein